MKKNTTTKRALSLEIRDDGVAIVTIDVSGESQNTLKAEFSEEFEGITQEIQQNSSVVAVVITSGKPASFLAGADIGMLKGCTTAEEATALSEKAQRAFQRLEAQRVPVVAAIHGPCLGGGLELALACTSRICTDDPKTVLAAPEVMLGLLPGAGGTQRLPRLIGIAAALDMMLTGRNIRPKKAVRLGLVDEAVPKAILLEVALEHARELAERGRTRHPGQEGKGARRSSGIKASLQARLLEDTRPGRAIVFKQVRKTLAAKTQGNYPAPGRIVDAVEIGYEQGLAQGYKAEARMFGELVLSSQARQLMTIYFAQNELKKDTGVDKSRVKPREVNRVGILGAGLMGAGIAYVTSVKADLSCRIKDKDDPALLAGLKSIRTQFDKRVKRKAFSRTEADRLFHKITGTIDYRGVAHCDIVIEAVFEDLALKRWMLREIEAISDSGTIFASNTSSIPITKIAEVSAHPETVIGMHYFSPVEKMPLLEIITTKDTSDEVTATCVALGKKQGKTVIVVRDGVGFYTSRILAPFMNEAARILSEGVPVQAIDSALKKWGFPVGPITLIDEVGIDVAEKVGHIMIKAFGARMEPPAIMERLVEDGRAGRKNKKGFYTYTGKKKVDESIYKVLAIKPTRKMDPVEIAERCALLFINEAMLCFGEGILRCPRDGDIGAIFGLGFPPFRGGPFRYVDDVGPDNIVGMLESYASKYGERFSPAPILTELASKGETFYR